MRDAKAESVDRFVLGLATLFVVRTGDAPFVERLIGTIRLEYLGRVVFWNAADLARKLEAFQDYCNGHRVHLVIAGLTPAQLAGAVRPAPSALDHYGWQQHCRGLFEIPVAA